MHLRIKFMVSLRCIMVVKEELNKLGLRYIAVHLGEAELSDDITKEQLDILKISLYKSGLELIEDKKSLLLEKIKTIITEVIYNEDELPEIKLSDYLAKRLNYRYADLARIFSEREKESIQQFFLRKKIERVKQLLLNEGFKIIDIAFMLNYSSVAHLSHQFKKITGHTPSHFRTFKKNQIEKV